SCRASRIASTSKFAPTRPPTIQTPAAAATAKRRKAERADAVLTPAQAEELIGQHLQCLPIESLPLAQCAGAVLRENIYAERDAPPFDRVSMDGIALDSGTISSGVRRLHIQATQAAGDAPLVLGARTSCIEVMTGAVLPTGCDAGVAVEEISIHDGHAELA